MNDRVITWVVLKNLILKLGEGGGFSALKSGIFFLVVLQPFSDILFILCAAYDKRAFNVPVMPIQIMLYLAGNSW